jgi:hypothetical protein
MKAYMIGLTALVAAISAGESRAAQRVYVSIENLSQPPNFQAEFPNSAPTAFPLWYAFHDGSVDIFDEGQPASAELAALAKEALIIPLMLRVRQDFPEATVNMVTNNFYGQDSVFETTNFQARSQLLDPEKHRFFSFAAKLVPSDDGFVGNDDPLSVRVFGPDGKFLGPIVIDVYGNEVWDAGVRLNNETGTLYVDNRPPDLSQGVATSEPIRKHPGYNGSVGNPGGSPVGILGVLGDICATSRRSVFCFQIDQTSGDFARPNYPIARIRISERVDASMSGSWSAPALSGEGYTFMVMGSPPQLAIGGYTYLPDGSGRQLWLFGTAAMSESGATSVPLLSTSGGAFASTQNPANVRAEPWGEIRVSFVNCEEALIRLYPISPEYVGFGDNRLIYLGRTLGMTPAGLDRGCFSPVFSRDDPDNSWPDLMDDIIEPQP